MNSILKTEDKIWKLFVEYMKVIQEAPKNEGIDLSYKNQNGVEQQLVLAQNLTIAHMLDNISCAINDIKEQQATFERTKYHIKPETIIQRPIEVIPEKGLPNA